MKYKPAAMAAMIIMAMIAILALAGNAYAANQRGTYTQICTWNGGWPQNCPESQLIMDPAGNLYGVSGYGLYNVVNELSPAGDGTWSENTIYTFGLTSGYNVDGPLVLDEAGNLYGTAFFGGLGTNQVQCYDELEGCGTVFELSPSQNGWNENTLYFFEGLTADGGNPEGPPTLNSSQTPTHIYGTTCDQGQYGAGTAFELIYSKQNGWIEDQIYNFPATSGGGGCSPSLLLKDGNLYGTDGFQIYELTKSSGGNWTLTTLYSGFNPYIVDISFGIDGNIYGTCNWCVTGNDTGTGNGGGQIFELVNTNGKMKMKFLHVFGDAPDGAGPIGQLVQDKAGNFYGVTNTGGVANSGTLFKMWQSESGEWKESPLHSFPHNYCDPSGALFIDGFGNLYGPNTCGTYEFKP